MVVSYRKEKADAEGNIADIGRNCKCTLRTNQEGNGMEIQRNKTLNRLFIVLAVLTIVLQIYFTASLIYSNVHLIGSFRVTEHFAQLLEIACVVLPILAITFRKHKAASVILSVVYLIIIAYMDWSSLSYLISEIIRYGIDMFPLIWLGEIIIKFAIGIFTLLNAVGKVQTKKVIAIVCFMLGIIEIVSMIIEPYRINLAECLMLFAIGMGILRDVPPEMFKKKQVQEGDHTMASKNKLTAILLSIFTGVLGVDRFYLGYTGLGVAKLLTAGGFGVWAIIDLVMICTGSLRPADGSPWEEEVQQAKITVPVNPTVNSIDALEKLAKLHEQGILTDEEFQQKKTDLLAKM